ncbi:hypothetical protein EK0264_13645 [Epidermidibacterium keratini]|uniref:Type VII secretion integral membrane protein EccD n=1 Tax=Epidermidibacterium keratini TaxID=1891644 RepID=A0A7L4YQ29_9ACTN|nr:EsaB/YukD family protein [Epidermidibacterium keratini]QHC01230.1 hypothetical protein EK0264_13645 [Epidermidibacterium keratini]
MSAVALTVCGPAVTRDLTIPSTVPLAILAPAIADEVAPELTPAFLEITAAAGTTIDLELSAHEAGITDGQVLVVRPRAGQAGTAVFDDPAAALAAQQITTPSDTLVRLSAALGVLAAVAFVLRQPAGVVAAAPAACVAGLAILLALTRIRVIRRDVVAVLITALAFGGLLVTLARWSMPAALATTVAAASYVPVILPSALLRLGGLRTRFAAEHSASSLADEAAAARRAAATREGAQTGALLAGGLGAGALLAWPHPAITAVVGCAVAASVARLVGSADPSRRFLLLLLGSSGYAGAVTLTAPAPAQLWSGVAILALAVALAWAPAPGPTAVRIVGVLETLSRAALGPLLLWVWGALDGVVLLIGTR